MKCRGKYTIRDIAEDEEFEKTKAMLRLMCELNEGRRSGEEVIIFDFTPSESSPGYSLVKLSVNEYDLYKGSERDYNTFEPCRLDSKRYCRKTVPYFNLFLITFYIYFR